MGSIFDWFVIAGLFFFLFQVGDLKIGSPAITAAAVVTEGV